MCEQNWRGETRDVIVKKLVMSALSGSLCFGMCMMVQPTYAASGENGTQYGLVMQNAMPKVIRATADRESRRYSEGETASLSLKLSEAFSDASIGYLFVVPMDADSSNLVECSAFETGVPIQSGSDEPNMPPTIRFLDGQSSTLLEYTFVLRDNPDINAGNEIGGFDSAWLRLFVSNVVPRVTGVSMDGTPLFTNNGTVEPKTVKGITQTFRIEGVYEPSDKIDLTNEFFMTEWKFYEGGAVLFSTNVYGNPYNAEIPYAFHISGMNRVTVRVKDKDMTTSQFASAETFTFYVETLDEPMISMFPSSGSSVIDETATPCTIDVYLDIAPTEDITLKIDVISLSAMAGGMLPKLNTHYVNIRAGSSQGSFEITELDGTFYSEFCFTASVTNETVVPNSGGKTWKECYSSEGFYITVQNVAPVIAGLASESAQMASINVPVGIPWTVSDVLPDMTNGMTACWTMEGATIAVPITNATGRSYSDMFYATFTSVGSKSVTLTVMDKDGAYASRRYYFLVDPPGRERVTAGGYEWTLDPVANTDTAMEIVSVEPSPTGNLTIPAMLADKMIANIGWGAFYGCSGLSNVTIPNSVTNIGDWAFEDCSGLTSVIFKGNAPIIGNSAFNMVKEGCTVYVRKDSTGWGVEIPGTWNGLNIQYLTPAVEIAVANETGSGTVEVDGELSAVEVASGVTLVVKGENLDIAALAANITPKPHEEGQSAVLFKVKTETVVGGVSLAVVLDEEAVAPDETAAEIVRTETVAALAAAVDGATVSVPLSGAKPGLYYGIAAASDLSQLEAAAANVPLVRADDGGVTVPVAKPAGSSSFFKVIVSDRAR